MKFQFSWSLVTIVAQYDKYFCIYSSHNSGALFLWWSEWNGMRLWEKRRGSALSISKGEKGHIFCIYHQIVNVSEMFLPSFNRFPKILPKSIGKFFKAHPSPPCCYAVIKKSQSFFFRITFHFSFLTSVTTLPLLFVLIRSPNHRLPFCFRAKIIATMPSWILFIHCLL